MRYEVVIQFHDGQERIVATTRREAGAINERNAYADSEYAIKQKHAAEGGRVAMGAMDDPRAVAIVYYDDLTEMTTVVTYREMK
jgi:hypothetical protein